MVSIRLCRADISKLALWLTGRDHVLTVKKFWNPNPDPKPPLERIDNGYAYYVAGPCAFRLQPGRLAYIYLFKSSQETKAG